MSNAKKAAKKATGARAKPRGEGGLGSVGKMLSLAVAIAALAYALVFSSSNPLNSSSQEQRAPRPSDSAPDRAQQRASGGPASHPPAWVRAKAPEPMDGAECARQQRKLTHMPVVWPGFHALCVDSVSPTSITVRALVRATDEVQVVSATDVHALLDALRPVLSSTHGDDDPTVVDSVYAYPPHEWELFSPVGEHISSASAQLAPGELVCVYEGGQFLWPGWEIGHVTNVDVPVVDERTGAESWRTVPITTASLRPLVFELSGFLTDAECEYIIEYASKRLVPSPLAHMDSSDRSEEGVRTSKQTFMARGGSRTILDLEHRAHNLTRLPYHLGENIQVVKYEKGQKYGAHRDFFSANDYHQQPQMLASVEYGARNRLATLFWYVSSVSEGGETFFPRALNANGTEYNPWNGDHEDCYRGLAVKPIKGNAVLFYSLLPDGRLDERSLHGGCRPRGESANLKWGANQWIWNHPTRYHGRTFPRKGAPARPAGPPGCMDESEHCAWWASSGECERNVEYMSTACKLSCGKCG